MKRSILAAAVTVLALAIPAVGAHAQMGSPVRVGVSGGVAFPLSSPVDVEGPDGGTAESKIGYNVAGHLGFQLPMFPLGLRADVGYGHFTGKELSDGFDTGRADSKILSGTLNALVQPAGMVALKPYFIGGVGVYRVTQAIRESGDGTDEKIDFTTNGFGINAGAGVRFGLAGLSTFAEARYHRVFNAQTCGEDEECLSRKATSFVPLSFGIMF
jgi:opacity protein-like surface antigen